MDRKWIVGVITIALLASISLLAPILWPFLMGALLAYLCDPLVERMSLSMPRTLAVSVVFILLIGLIALLAFTLFPLLVHQIHYLIMQIPQLIHWLQSQAWFNERLSFDFPVETIQKNWRSVGTAMSWMLQAVSRSGLLLIHIVVTLLLILVILFYLLRDWKGVLQGLKSLLPKKQAATILTLVKQCNEVLSAFFRGQLLVMLLLSLFYTVSLSLLGLRLSVLIGVVAGLLSIVPYLGFIVGLGATLLASFFQFHAWFPVGTAGLIFVVGHGLESFLLIPWLVGDKVGLHPVAVIFAMLAGGELFGFVGLLLALPVAAVVMVLLRSGISSLRKAGIV